MKQGPVFSAPKLPERIVVGLSGRITRATPTLVRQLIAATREAGHPETTLHVVRVAARRYRDSANIAIGRVGPALARRLGTRSDDGDLLTPIARAGDVASRRGVLRTCTEVVCAVSDVVVVCTIPRRSEVDAAMNLPGWSKQRPHYDPRPDNHYYTLRQALMLRRPVIWIGCEIDAEGRPIAPRVRRSINELLDDAAVARLSRLHSEDRVACWNAELATYFNDVEADGDDLPALIAWTRRYVVPGILRPEVHEVGAGPHDTESAAGVVSDYLGKSKSREGLGLFLDRQAPMVFELLSSVLRNDGKRAWAKSVGTLNDAGQRDEKLIAPDLYAFDRAAKCFEHLGVRSEVGDALDHYRFADRAANIDGGRSRTMTWFGFLLAFVAVAAASLGTLEVEFGDRCEAMSRALCLPERPLLVACLSIFCLVAVALLVRALMPAPSGSLAPSESMLRSMVRVNVISTLAYSVCIALALIGLAAGVLELRGASAAWEKVSGLVEGVALLLILFLTVSLWKIDAHQHWLVSRSMAETLRFQQVAHPILGFTAYTIRAVCAPKPSSDYEHAAHRAPGDSGEPKPSQDGRHEATARPEANFEIADGHAWLVKRIFSARPLPGRVSAAADPAPPALQVADCDYLSAYANYLGDMINHQATYHRTRAYREEVHEETLHSLTTALFCVSGAVVIGHLFFHEALHGLAGWLGLLAIVVPAFAANLHAVNKQHECARLRRSSAGMVKFLDKRSIELQAIRGRLAAAPAGGTDWQSFEALRDLAVVTATALNAEVFDWYDDIALQAPHLPA